MRPSARFATQAGARVGVGSLGRAVVLFLALVAGLDVATAATGAPAAARRGSLVIAGGALKAETADVWSRIVALAGGQGASIAVFGTASDDPAASAGDVVAILERYGAHAYVVPVVVGSKSGDVRAAAHDRRNVALVARAGGVYFTGGDQGRITRALVGPAGARSPVLDAVWRVFARGGVVAGSSAGAAIMSTTMFLDPRSGFDLLVDGVRPGQDIAAGLGFAGDALFVDQHALARGRFARMIPAMRAAGYRVGLGIDENTAAIVARDGRIAIAGRSGAVLVDLAQARDTSTSPVLRLTGVRIGLLGPGDAYDPASRVVTPSARKRLVMPAASDDDAVRHIDDILGRDALVDAMTALAGGAREVDGLAPSDGRPAMRFVFRRSGVTRIFRDDAPPLRGWTILDVDVDVAPVTP